MKSTVWGMMTHFLTKNGSPAAFGSLSLGVIGRPALALATYAPERWADDDEQPEDVATIINTTAAATS